MDYKLKRSFYTICVILATAIAAPYSNCLAQNHLSIFEEPGGGSQPTQTSNGNDNTFIYVAGGLLIAGILAYALLVKKDKTEESDTTSLSSATDLINTNIPDDPVSEISKAKEMFPVDFFFGIRNDEAVLRGKTYLLGVSFKL